MQKSSRESYIDNVKVMLIFLVVIGHSIRPFTHSVEWLNTLYHWIYLFHMPAFILISGYFTKQKTRKGHYKKLFLKLIIPYILFEFFYTYFIATVFDKPFELSLFTPYWLTWYLLSLFCWHLMLPIFKNIPYGLLATFIIASLAGYVDELGKDYSLMRTLSFFPFFLMGHYLSKDHISILKKPVVQVTSFILLFASYIYASIGTIHLRFLWNSLSFSSSGFHGLEALSYRITYFLVMTLLVLALLSLIPAKPLKISSIGANTMYIYLLHGFIIRLVMYKFDWIQPPTTIVTTIIFISFVISVILLFNQKWIHYIFQPIVEPYNTYIWLKSIIFKETDNEHAHKKC